MVRVILQIEETLDNWLSENIDLVIIDAVGEKAFCAGASFEELSNIKNFEEGKKFFMKNFRQLLFEFCLNLQS